MSLHWNRTEQYHWGPSSASFCWGISKGSNVGPFNARLQITHFNITPRYNFLPVRNKSELSGVIKHAHTVLCSRSLHRVRPSLHRTHHTTPTTPVCRYRNPLIRTRHTNCQFFWFWTKSKTWAVGKPSSTHWPCWVLIERQKAAISKPVISTLLALSSLSTLTLILCWPFRWASQILTTCC